MPKIENARLERVAITNETSAAPLAFYVDFSWAGGSGQAWGPWAVGYADPFLSAVCCSLLDVFDGNYISQLNRTPARILREDRMIIAIGHFIDDRWLYRHPAPDGDLEDVGIAVDRLDDVLFAFGIKDLS